MRDDFTKQHTSYGSKWRTILPQYPYNYSSTHTSSRTQRGDLTVVPWINGFRHSTNYTSFFGSCRGLPYSYSSKIGSRIWEHEGIASSGRWGGGNLYGWGTTNTSVRVPVVSNNDKNRVTSEALAKLAQGDLNLGVALAEMPKTIRLVASSIAVVLRTWNAVKRRDYHLAVKILTGTSTVKNPKFLNYELGPAEFWLSLQYGWRPLLSDIFGAIDALNSDWSDYPPLLSVIRTRTWNKPDQPVGAIRTKGQVKMGCEVKLYYQIDNDLIHFLGSLGLTNPALIAWELVPFSFVLDWFVPIGTWLEALGAKHLGISYVGGYMTTFANADFTAEFSDGAYLVGTPETLLVNYRCMQRVRYTVMPLAIPYIKSGWSTSHLISALALLKSATQNYYR